MAGGALATLAIARGVDGRAVLFPNRIKWSAGEARFSSFSTAFGGVVLGIYGLVVAMGQSLMPAPWLTPVHSTIMLVILVAVFFPPALIEQRHKRRGPLDQGRM
jgi:hypothetical protein